MTVFQIHLPTSIHHIIIHGWTVYMLVLNTVYIRLEKHLQCEKLLGLVRGTTKKRGNKKSDERITPIRYRYAGQETYLLTYLLTYL